MSGQWIGSLATALLDLTRPRSDQANLKRTVSDAGVTLVYRHVLLERALYLEEYEEYSIKM